MIKDLRIVFMGTPEFAVATLGSLLMNGFNVVGVVTTPDKPAGRGRKMSMSAVKEFAEFSYLPIMQPANLKDPLFIKDLSNLEADLFIVVAFRMLPEIVWKIPPMGTINLHASLLPHYRGAAPINHAIINGEHCTGVTTFFINDKIDTGNLLLREEVQIFPYENAGDLHDRLMKLGARLVIRTIKGLAEKTIIPMPQSQFIKAGEIPKTAPKIFPEDCNINWNSNCFVIHNLIRGLSPYPCARTFIADNSSVLMIKLYETHAENEMHSLTPGQILSDGKYYMKIACNHGFVNIISLQLEGKKRMSVLEFLRGFRISDYKITSNQPV
jgi:methionyl-tRNA formyltransferase